MSIILNIQSEKMIDEMEYSHVSIHILSNIKYDIIENLCYSNNIGVKL